MSPAPTRLFGPLLFYDALRTARQERTFKFRSFYAVLLLALLFSVYYSWFANRPGGLANLFAEVSLKSKDVARFAGAFFATFMVAQFAAVLLLTPVYASGAITEEKERRTLEYLLATDLTNREIVLGKLTARLGNVVLLILTGLPVLGFLQFLGGVDPNLVLAGFTATALTMLSVGAASVMASVMSDKSLDALILTYFLMAVFLVLSALLAACLPISVGNPVVACIILNKDLVSSPSPGRAVFLLLLEYCLVHVALASVCLVLAIRQLRLRIEPKTRSSVEEASPVVQSPVKTDQVPAQADIHLEDPSTSSPGQPETQPDQSVLRDPSPRSPVGNDPLLWKEMYAQQSFRRYGLRPLMVMVLGLTVSLAAMLLLVAFLRSMGFSINVKAVSDRLGPEATILLRFVGLGVACLLLVRIAFIAAQSVSRERERHTLDGLLSFPYERRDILHAKWLGSILAVRLLWSGLGVIWGLGLLAQALDLFALVLLVFAMMVYACFLASLGLWFSTTSSTSTRATLKTLVVLLILCLNGWVLGGNAGNLLRTYLPLTVADQVVQIQVYGLTPPVPLVVFAYYRDGFIGVPLLSSAARVRAALGGLLCYAGAAYLLWRRTLARFRAEAGPPFRRQRHRLDKAAAPKPV